MTPLHALSRSMAVPTVARAIVGKIEGKTNNANRGITALEISIIWRVTFVLLNIIDNTDEASRFI